jgi:hypothetical protein
VTFSFETSSLASQPYPNQGHPVHDLPMYQANTAGTPQFWLDYVEEPVSAGVLVEQVDHHEIASQDRLGLGTEKSGPSSRLAVASPIPP